MKRMALLLMLATTIDRSGLAQEIDRLEFYATPIAEILVALGAATGNAIVPDESVTGSTSYFVDNTSFEPALATFARHHNLYVTREEDIYLVSRIQIQSKNDRYSVNAASVSTRALLSVLFESTNRELQLLSDRDPMIGPINFESKTFDQLVTLITEQANMRFERVDNLYHIWDQGDRVPTGHERTLVIEPRHVPVHSVAELLQPLLTGGTSVRSDTRSGLLIVSGSPAEVSRIVESIALIDRPSPTISYQILIVEYHEESATRVESIIRSGLTRPDSVQAFSGSIGPLLALDFDVLSALGYEFALELAGRLESNRATIVMDTTLHGLSGESVRFENNQIRRVWSADPEGSARPPILREVRAGLETEVTGRVTDPDEIIVSVEAAVSRFDGTTSDARIPDSRERVVATTARALSGTPIALSAYVEEASGRSQSGPSLLARIPIIGRLFGASADKSSATELGIYLIPRIEGSWSATWREQMKKSDRFALTVAVLSASLLSGFTLAIVIAKLPPDLPAGAPHSIDRKSVV